MTTSSAYDNIAAYTKTVNETPGMTYEDKVLAVANKAATVLEGLHAAGDFTEFDNCIHAFFRDFLPKGYAIATGVMRMISEVIEDEAVKQRLIRACDNALLKPGIARINIQILETFKTSLQTDYKARRELKRKRDEDTFEPEQPNPKRSATSTELQRRLATSTELQRRVNLGLEQGPSLDTEAMLARLTSSVMAHPDIQNVFSRVDNLAREQHNLAREQQASDLRMSAIEKQQGETSQTLAKIQENADMLGDFLKKQLSNPREESAKPVAKAAEPSSDEVKAIFKRYDKQMTPTFRADLMNRIFMENTVTHGEVEGLIQLHIKLREDAKAKTAATKAAAEAAAEAAAGAAAAKAAGPSKVATGAAAGAPAASSTSSASKISLSSDMIPPPEEDEIYNVFPQPPNLPPNKAYIKVNGKYKEVLPKYAKELPVLYEGIRCVNPPERPGNVPSNFVFMMSSGGKFEGWYDPEYLEGDTEYTRQT